MQLRRWCDANGYNDKFLARDIGVTRYSAWRYITGKRIPPVAQMIRVYVLTGGKVQPNDFYPLPPLNDETTQFFLRMQGQTDPGDTPG